MALVALLEFLPWPSRHQILSSFSRTIRSDTREPIGFNFNKTREIIGGNGATAKNWFAHTPICCPSRAEILTGRIFPQPANCLAARPRLYAHKRFGNMSSSEFYSKVIPILPPIFKGSATFVDLFGKDE